MMWRGKERPISTLVLLRHGQSAWNRKPTFSGWCDVALTSRGRREAREAGELLAKRGYGDMSMAFTSELQRAYETCHIVVEALGGRASVVRDQRFNERHYGALQGLAKDDPGLISEYGERRVSEWRRSLHSRPPALTPEHPHYREGAPLTESLADARTRVLKGFEDIVAPELFREGAKILLVAHSNTLRALISHFDEVPEKDIPGLHVPNSVPISYDFDRDHRFLRPKLGTTTTAVGSHARWLLSEENQAKILEALQPGGLLARALFDAWDADNSRTLDAVEIQNGLHMVEHDVALAAIARRIVRKIHFSPQDGSGGGGTCSRDDFDACAAEVMAELQTEKRRAASPKLLFSKK
ncbi:hypothetical protein CTAYLR_006912 [Chrysophaeum taylorii]|uniref:Phosphoglycerate mutase n=1 Tax=Chrysophaeum taylorii TaxID=2483200 RepID=A0AAD7XJN1_9STRA|nr:hypothetical protein CTAYLR_006912 [Chrysophaeum taylorii]